MSAEAEKVQVQTNPQWLSRGLWLEGLAALAVTVGLYGFIPYNFGFDSKAIPVLNMLKRFWTDPSAADWHHGMMVPFISYRDWETDRKSTRLNSSHSRASRMPSSA